MFSRFQLISMLIQTFQELNGFFSMQDSVFLMDLKYGGQQKSRKLLKIAN